MDIQLLKDSKAVSQALALVLIILGFGIFVSLLGIILSIPFIEGPIMEAFNQMSSMDTSTDIHLMKYFQIVSQLGFFVIPALVFGFLIQKNLGDFFNINKAPTLLFTALGLLVIFMANPFNEWLVYQNNQMNLPSSLSSLENWMRQAEESAAIATNKFLQMEHFSDYILNVFMIGLMAALGEELLMRGALQPLLIRIFKNPHIGVWITAMIFSTIHFQFYGFFARMFLGAVLGYSYYYSKNLWIPIIAHFFNNSLAVTYVYISNEPLYNTSQGIIEVENVKTLYAIISLSLVILGLILMRHYALKKGLLKTH